MHFFILFCSFFVVSLSSNLYPIRKDLHYGDTRLPRYINRLQTTWKAGYNPRFRGMRHSVIRGMLGVPLSKVRNTPGSPLSKTMLYDMDIPESFDSRQKWSNCMSVKQVRDQSACGSCWSFGAVEAMSDRICIASRGLYQVDLSAADLMECCHNCGMGCDGGEPLAAWQYWVSDGIVTGYNYTSQQGCKPYPFPPCEHHINSTHLPSCKHSLYPTPRCSRQCNNDYRTTYQQDKHYGKSAYAVDSAVESIQKEILTHGPVEVAFEVYEDFLHYKSGVYQHHAGHIDGGHAVKMIGWGVENGTPYWLVVNSWNSDWGDKGLFKILRGSDECGIESGVVGGIPTIPRGPSPYQKKQNVRMSRKGKELLRRFLDLLRDKSEEIVDF